MKKLSTLRCFGNICLLWGFSIQFPDFFFLQKSDSPAYSPPCTKQPPRLFISGAPPHHATNAVWRLRRACAGRWRRCLLILAANPTGSQEEKMTAASVIMVWASGSCSHKDTPADGENVWQVTRGQRTSLTLHFCLYSVALCTETPQNLPHLDFW